MIKKILFIFSLSVLFIPNNIAFAATMKLVSSPSVATVGETIRVDVLVSSPKTSLNLVAGTINFSTENLQLVSLSKTGTIVNFWTAEPSFSNNDGKVFFEGGVLNPGFTGNNGKVVSIYFKVLKAGIVSLTFTSPVVLANDGKGTSIFDVAYSTDITLVPQSSSTKIKPIITPKQQDINSSTEPTFEFVTSTTTPVSTSTDRQKIVLVMPSSTARDEKYEQSLYGLYPMMKGFLSSEIVSDLTIGIVLVSLITTFLMILFYLVGRIQHFFVKKPLQEELKHMDTLVSRIFIRFEKDITQHLSDINEVSKKRPLTEEEQRFLFQFSQLLKESEADIRTSMKDVL